MNKKFFGVSTEEIILIIFFIFGTFFYLNLDGVALSHPGNIKAADPFYHVISVEEIIDTSQWNYFDYYLSLGQEKAVNYQPPLIYLNAAILTLFSGVPAWVTLYFLVCLSQAFIILIVYLIAYEVFENRKIALLAAGLAILPIPVRIWLYGVFIGFWLQVPSYFLVMVFTWLTIKYVKHRTSWILPVLSLIIVAIMLVHISDLVLILFCFLLVLFIILLDFLKDRSFLKSAKKLLILGIAPFIMLILLLPRILYVWSAIGGSQYTLGWYSLSRDLFPKDAYGGGVWPSLTFMPVWEIILFIIGMLLLFGAAILFLKSLKSKNIGSPSLRFDMQSKKVFIKYNKDSTQLLSVFLWFMIVLVYFASLYLSPLIFSSPYYLAGRARALQPFFIFPTIAFLLYMVFEGVKSFAFPGNSNAHRTQSSDSDNSFSLGMIFSKGEVLLILIIAGILVFSQLGEYNSLKEQLKYEHLSLEEWNAYIWIQDNTPKTSKVLIFGGVSQAENVYTKRICAAVSYEEVQNMINMYIATNQTPLEMKTVGWAGNTLREGGWKYEISFMKYGTYSEFNTTVKVTDFDYIIFQDLSPEIAQVNRFFANEYMKDYNFTVAYNKDGYFIIRR